MTSVTGRPDYNEQIDMKGDEPIFVIKAGDVAAPEAIEAWADLNDKYGGHTYMSGRARDYAKRMREWQKVNPTLVKTADL